MPLSLALIFKDFFEDAPAYFSLSTPNAMTFPSFFVWSLKIYFLIFRFRLVFFSSKTRLGVVIVFIIKSRRFCAQRFSTRFSVRQTRLPAHCYYYIIIRVPKYNGWMTVTKCVVSYFAFVPIRYLAIPLTRYSSHLPNSFAWRAINEFQEDHSIIILH